MTSDELRALADAATPGPWCIGPWCIGPDDETHWVLGRVGENYETDWPALEADTRLIALAPDLAWLCADMAQIMQNARVSEWPHGGSYEELMDDLEGVLAKLAELEAR